MLGDDNFVIADADILVSVFLEKDINHDVVIQMREKAVLASLSIKFPNTSILEAVTVLRRVFNRPDYANKIIDQYLSNKYDIVYVDDRIQKLASEIFSKTKSKKNTIFDCIVLATAKITNAAAIFSFDDFYKRSGMKKFEDLI